MNEEKWGGRDRREALYVLLGHEKTLVYTLSEMERHGGLVHGSER